MIYRTVMCVAVALLAQPSVSDELRERHYEHVASQPNTREEARGVLKNTVSEMAKKIEKKDYESVHKLSYSLESSINWLKNEKNNTNLAKKQLELIELYADLVHHGSEDSKFDKVHQYFPALQAETSAYLLSN